MHVAKMTCTELLGYHQSFILRKLNCIGFGTFEILWLILVDMKREFGIIELVLNSFLKHFVYFEI